jgi:hypothetical protein
VPTNRNRRRRRHGSAEEVAAWGAVFGFGLDFWGELRAFGTVAVDPYGQVSPEDLTEAWARLGPAFLATWTPEPGRPEPWAAAAAGRAEGEVRQPEADEDDPAERFFQ